MSIGDIRRIEMSNLPQREWNHQKLLSVFTGLLVLVGAIYGITTILQLRSMNNQALLMAQQLDIMKEQIDDVKLTRSADLMLRFDALLDKPLNARLRLAIENGKPILKEHGGKFSADDLESYIAIFDSLNDLYQREVINKDLFYNDYSYDIEKAYENREIQSYLQDIRKQDAQFFVGFDSIAKEMKAFPKPVASPSASLR